jgi:predicted DNA-binding WGR domain protein
MPALTLRRIDPARNMRRFYRLDLQPDLFGAWGVVREWGRIGRPGRVRVDPYSTEAEAAAKMQRQRARKQSRGYTLFANAESEPRLGGSRLSIP